MPPSVQARVRAVAQTPGAGVGGGHRVCAEAVRRSSESIKAKTGWDSTSVRITIGVVEDMTGDKMGGKRKENKIK